MEKGDILLIPFPFTDLKGNKNRPALVLINSDLDVTLAFISTQLKWKEETDILLKPNKNNGLKKDSVLRLGKIATIDKNLVLGRIGRMDANVLKQVNLNLIKLFKLDWTDRIQSYLIEIDKKQQSLKLCRALLFFINSCTVLDILSICENCKERNNILILTTSKRTS